MTQRRLIQSLITIAALVVVVAITYQASSQPTLAAATLIEPATTIAELGWISGDWQTAAGGQVRIEEHWTAPAAGTMMGVGRTIAGGKTVEFEYLRIEQRGEEIFYVASPKGRCPATDFKLTKLAAQEATFENPEHDFPKRVIYRKNSDGSLTANIDGGAGTKSMSFAYLPMAK
ncbi:MAG TPA: DUF6265 family protein [Pyrinomonadaceae bacterium]|nr:DUF6265 family protein [Pyrinomonadaceae bacterium]